MLCVEFAQVQNFDLTELIPVVKAVAIVTSEHSNLSTIFVINHFLIAKMSTE